MDQLRLRLLGPAHVETGEPPVQVDLATQKGTALLVYLATRPEQPVARARLLAMLWQESDEQEGRNNLSTALSRLRRTVADAPIQAVGDSLVWRPDQSHPTATDLAEFIHLTRPNASPEDLDKAV